MALRIATRLPRLVIVGAVLLLASATLAVGAAKGVGVTGCLCLASLQVDFPVSVKGTSVGAYELKDTIFLRNSSRI